MTWIALVLTLPCYGQSLTETAKQERERRAKLGADDKKVVYTNADLEALKSKGHITSNSPYEAMPKEKAGADKSQNAKSWHSRMVRAEDKIRTLKLKVEGYDKQIRDLATAPAEAGRGTRAQARRRTRLAAGGRTQHTNRLRALQQRKDKAEKDLQRALDEKQRIEEEARKAGVLPGVLRGQ
jgi:chromosome segregation ATPase